MATLPRTTTPSAPAPRGGGLSEDQMREIARQLFDTVGIENFDPLLAYLNNIQSDTSRAGPPSKGSVATNMTTGERRMILPPRSGRENLPRDVMYNPRVATRKNELGQDVGTVVHDWQGGIAPEAQLGPGVPIPPAGEEKSFADRALQLMGSSASSPQSENVEGVNPAQYRTDKLRSKFLSTAKDKGMVSPRNIPEGLTDFDLNKGEGGPVRGVQTVAGQAVVERQMNTLVDALENFQPVPRGIDPSRVAQEYYAMFGSRTPLWQRYAKANNPKTRGQR